MSLADIKEWIEFIWPFIRPLAALLCTFTIVSFFKSILKHYKSTKWDKFTIVSVTRVTAFVTGYAMAWVFMRDLDHAEELAFGLAVLNIPIYSGLIKFATHRQWLWMIALLKGRKLIKRQENGETIEKVMDEDDKTMISRRTTD